MRKKNDLNFLLKQEHFCGVFYSFTFTTHCKYYYKIGKRLERKKIQFSPNAATSLWCFLQFYIVPYAGNTYYKEVKFWEISSLGIEVLILLLAPGGHSAYNSANTGVSPRKFQATQKYQFSFIATHKYQFSFIATQKISV